MNNKEFIGELATKLDMSNKDVQSMISDFITEFSEQLEDDNTLSIQGFGSFEVKKKLERVVVNPVTKQRMLVPPKLVLGFKPSAVLKDKLNEVK